MGEERTAKLRLKRPRAGPEPRPSGHSCSWFEEKEQNDSTALWKLVLQATCPNVKEIQWDTMPPLPEPYKKCTGDEKKPRKPDTFNVGTKQFEWTAFPSFTEVDQPCLKSSSLCRSLHKQTTDLKEERDMPVSREKSLACVTSFSVIGREPDAPSKNSRVQQNAKESKQLTLQCPAKNIQNLQAQWTSGSISSSLPATSQGCLSIENPVQEKVEGKARERLWAVPQEQETVTKEAAGTIGAPPKAGELREGSENVNALLQSCPMCLIQFTERFTQLDIDCHLAQCLSESAEDIVW